MKERKNPEVEALEESQHPEWALEHQTEGLNKVRDERFKAESAKARENEKPTWYRYLIRRFYG